jgi:hypothetical protein
MHTYLLLSVGWSGAERRLLAKEIVKGRDFEPIIDKLQVANAAKGSKKAGFPNKAKEAARDVMQLGQTSLADTINNLRLSKTLRRQDKLEKYLLKSARDEIKASTNRHMSRISKIFFRTKAAELAFLEKRTALRKCKDIMGYLEHIQGKTAKLLSMDDAATALENGQALPPLPPAQQKVAEALTAVSAKLEKEVGEMGVDFSKYEAAEGKETELRKLLVHFDVVKPPLQLNSLLQENQRGDKQLQRIVKAASFIDPELGGEIPGAKTAALDMVKALRSRDVRNYQDIKLLQEDLNAMPIDQRLKSLVERKNLIGTVVSLRTPAGTTIQAEISERSEDDPTQLIAKETGSSRKIVMDTTELKAAYFDGGKPKMMKMTADNLLIA